MTYVIFHAHPVRYLCDMAKCTEIHSTHLRNFQALSQEARERLLVSSESLTLPKGSLVFEENQPLSKLFCIKKGACKFSKADNQGQEHILRFLGEGDVMGKRSIVSNTVAQVSATTLTETELCCLERREIQKNLENNPEFCHDFMSSLVEDANNDDRTRVQFYMRRGIKQRLAKLLLYLLRKFGADEEGKLNLKLKRDDVASVLGTSPEYIINLLKKFKMKELIRTKNSDVFIISKSGLDDMAV
ncbi:MAG: Crp/Fnr family transcriptional regulator [Bacteroidota bacterium]